MKTKVRTRFAPSPTGFLHVGAARTALFAWLVAKQNDGQFILRIEDTDQARGVGGSVEHIQKSLEWLGLDWDEGPYFQSQRLDIYKKYAQTLIDKGRAYADPYSPEEVTEFREQAKLKKIPFLYRNHRPKNPPTWDGTQPLRFLSEPRSYKENDQVMGNIGYVETSIDDFILIKSDGFPTYNFAHIVDDHEMQITHIIRGQEFLPSHANYFNLYEALDIKAPLMATVPPIMNEQGNKKLSKRDGAKDLLDYQKEGFLPEAMINFLATLGWNDGTEQEIFTTNELIQRFNLDRVQKSGARFDERRLLWLNGSHIRQLTLDQLDEKTKALWPEEASNASDAYKKTVLGLVQERLKFFSELPELTRFFFKDLPVDPSLISSHKQLSKLPADELNSLLKKSQDTLEQSDFSLDDLTKRLNRLLEETGQKPVVVFSLIRIATTQAPASPSLAETLHVLGSETSLRRIKVQLNS